MEISFTHILPPGRMLHSVEHYRNGYAWGLYAKQRYGTEAVTVFRKTWLNPHTSYERGTLDALDGKPNKYGEK